MFDFDVQRCTRRCAKTERELEPGELVHSVLVPDGVETVRRDYSAEGWEGPPENTIGYWKSRIPAANSNKVNWAPNDVMLDYFARLEGNAEKQDVRYVLALLLMRRRVVRMEDTESREDGTELMVLHCPKNETDYRVDVSAPRAERVKEIQEELAELLFGGET